MSVSKSEEDAINRAVLLVENMLQKPDQLQKVEQYKRRVQRKKLSVEAMLKTAMQSQLDGVRTGLNQLQAALVDLKEIKGGLADIETSLVNVPKLNNSLQSCRDEYLRHSQYAAARENLKHIFTVPDSIEKTKQYIADGKLLNAHQCITDLENSRDDLLFELHKLPHHNPNEIRLLKEYFSDMQTLSVELGKQLWVIMRRTLNTVRKEPTQVVTALRIIEREERADQYALSRQKSSTFLPPGRPREWRKKAFEVLDEVVQQRIECNQFEERDTNKNWLIRHLEVIRLMLIEDFKVIQSQCVPCFPKHYNILSEYIQIYHRNLSNHVKDFVESGLQDNEIVTLLSWVLNTYAGRDLMGHPSLKVDATKLEPLLDNQVLEQLKTQYLENVRSNYDSWMDKALQLESREWRREEPPPSTADGHYKTELPHLLHDMVRQNLDVASTISSEVQAQVLIASLERIKLFANKYESAISAYKDDYFIDRSQIQYFTCYMIALGNSSHGIQEVMIGVKQRFWRPGNATHVDRDVATHFEALSKAYMRLRDTVCDFLMMEALTDLEEQFNRLVTQRWLTDQEPMDTICLTLNDYFQDYTHLHPKIFENMAEMALNTLGARYLTAILQRRITIKTDEDRRNVAERIMQDAAKLQTVFDTMLADLSENASEVRPRFDSPCEAMKGLAEAIRVDDLEFLGLEIHRLLRRYPDITSDHLTALLLLRGDIGRLDVRQRVVDSLKEAKSQKGAIAAAASGKTIFSYVHVQVLKLGI